MWTSRRKIERVQQLAAMAHEIHQEMTDLITGADLDMAERYIEHALKVLRDREEATRA